MYCSRYLLSMASRSEVRTARRSEDKAGKVLDVREELARHSEECLSLDQWPDIVLDRVRKSLCEK